MKGKLLITTMMAAWLAGGSAFASIPRVAVMGSQPVFTSQGGSGVVSNAVNGSLWYDDDYNVFYNPSALMDNKNYVTVQKGLEGGFFKGEFENFAYGIYMNRGGGAAQTGYGGGQFVSPGVASNTNLINGLNASSGVANTASSATLNTQRPIELFLAGDTGIKWGAHVAWAYNRTQTGATVTNADGEITNRYWHFDLGAQVMGFEPFIGATLFSKYQNTAASTNRSVEQALDEFNAGLRYKYEGWTPYVAFKKFREGAKGLEALTQAQVRMNHYGIGVSHDTKVADGVHIYKNIAYWMNSVEDDAGIAESAKDYKETVVPINVAVEGDATSWLTLRAGASMDLINQRKFARSSSTASLSVADKVTSVAGTPTFRVGSTLKFGKLHVDSAFGTGATTAEAVNLDSQNVGFDSQTFALLSASYHW